jgi:hypothetical protein
MSDSNRKTITVNLDAFKIPSIRRTRKNTDAKDPQKNIRVKAKPKSNKSLKHNLLKFIRNRQEKRFNDSVNVTEPGIEETSFKSEFNASLEYLSDVAKRANEMPAVLNRTLKNTSSLSPVPILLTNLAPVPDVISTIRPYGTFSLPQPKYGCLKGGTLPSYHQYTRRNLNPVDSNIKPTIARPTNHVVPPVISHLTNHVVPPVISQTNAQPSLLDEMKLKQSILRSAMLHNNDKAQFNPRRHRKTTRRTYRLGKSSNVPKVSVLISNRTIRNQISNRTQALKQTPIQDVKKYLIQNGFIKVGSIAPNDVLRKMYETSMLACGVIHNYNPENTVYNYFATGGEPDA